MSAIEHRLLGRKLRRSHILAKANRSVGVIHELPLPITLPINRQSNHYLIAIASII